MLRRLTLSSNSKFLPRSVSLRWSPQHNGFGFALAGGLETNSLPRVVFLPNCEILCRKGKLYDGAEVLEINGRFVAGDCLKNIVRFMDLSKSDTITLTILDASSPLCRASISQLLASQKSSGKTAEYIELIRCKVYENTTAITTRPQRKEGESENYVFVTREEFLAYVQQERMLEWGEHAVTGFLYGTLIPGEGDAPPAQARAVDIRAVEGGAQSPSTLLETSGSHEREFESTSTTATTATTATAAYAHVDTSPAVSPSYSSASGAGVDFSWGPSFSRSTTSTSAGAGAASVPLALVPLHGIPRRLDLPSSAPIHLVGNVVVVTRRGFYDGWGFTLAGGGAGTDMLPYVASVTDTVQQAAWLNGPLAVNSSVLAVNGVNVAAAAPSHILGLMNKLCAAELTLVHLPSSVAPSTPVRALSYTDLLRAQPLSASLVHAQTDVRAALFECSKLETTRAATTSSAAASSGGISAATTAYVASTAAKAASAVGTAASGTSPTAANAAIADPLDVGVHVPITDDEFAARAGRGDYLAWMILDDGVRCGVPRPLHTWCNTSMPSRLHTHLQRLVSASRGPAPGGAEVSCASAQSFSLASVSLPSTSTVDVILPAASISPRVLPFTLVSLPGTRHHTINLLGQQHAPAPSSSSTDAVLPLAQGMVLEAINGSPAAGKDTSALVALLAAPGETHLSVRHAWDHVLAAHAKPVPVQRPAMVSNVVAVAGLLAVLVLLVAVLLECLRTAF